MNTRSLGVFQKKICEYLIAEVIIVPEAVLWSEDSPKLYICSVAADSDVAEVRFGIRMIAWDSKRFYINVKSTLLRSGCIHHDNWILGTATPDEADYRRARELKAKDLSGVNIAQLYGAKPNEVGAWVSRAAKKPVGILLKSACLR